MQVLLNRLTDISVVFTGRKENQLRLLSLYIVKTPPTLLVHREDSLGCRLLKELIRGILSHVEPELHSKTQTISWSYPLACRTWATQ